jgi:hypothetical protein
MTVLRKIFVVVLILGTYTLCPEAFGSEKREQVLRNILAESAIQIPDKDRAIAILLNAERQVGRNLTKQEVLWKLKFMAEPPTQGPNKKRRCFTCSMRVLAPTGYVRLDHLQVGDSVYSWDETQRRLVLNEIAQIHNAEDSEYGKLPMTPTGVELEVTADHPFFLPEIGEYRDLDQIKTHEKLLAIMLNGATCENWLLDRGEWSAAGRANVITLAMKNLPHNFIVEGLVVHNKPIF